MEIFESAAKPIFLRIGALFAMKPAKPTTRKMGISKTQETPLWSERCGSIYSMGGGLRSASAVRKRKRLG